MISLVAPQTAQDIAPLRVVPGLLSQRRVMHNNPTSLQVFQTYWVYLSTAVLALISALRPLHPMGVRSIASPSGRKQTRSL